MSYITTSYIACNRCGKKYSGEQNRDADTIRKFAKSAGWQCVADRRGSFDRCPNCKVCV